MRAVALKVGEDSPARCGSAQESEALEGYALSREHARESNRNGHTSRVRELPIGSELTQLARRLCKAAQTTSATPVTINERDPLRQWPRCGMALTRHKQSDRYAVDRTSQSSASCEYRAPLGRPQPLYILTSLCSRLDTLALFSEWMGPSTAGERLGCIVGCVSPASRHAAPI